VADQRLAARARILAAVYAARPERFPRGMLNARLAGHRRLDQPTGHASRYGDD
jgi:hypothetical protein